MAPNGLSTPEVHTAPAETVGPVDLPDTIFCIKNAEHGGYDLAAYTTVPPAAAAMVDMSAPRHAQMIDEHHMVASVLVRTPYGNMMMDFKVEFTRHAERFRGLRRVEPTADIIQLDGRMKIVCALKLR